MSWLRRLFGLDDSGPPAKRQRELRGLEPRPIDADAEYLLGLLEQSARSPHSGVRERIGDTAFRAAVERLLERGQARLCADLLGRFAMLVPRDVVLNEKLVDVLLTVDDLDAAERVLERLRAVPDAEARTRMTLATLHERRGDTLRAREELERVLALDVDFPSARQRLAALQAAEPSALATLGGVGVAGSALGLTSQLGRYRLERELGRGGAGIVYVAHDPALDRQLAVKLLYQAQTQPGAAFEQLTEEVELVARLRHPGLCAIYDVDIERGVIVMELCRGGTLAARPVDEADALAILASLVEVLGYLHEAGVVHGDLKPDNILFRDGRPRAVLTDFGLARRAGQNERAGGGTRGFLAPEVVERGELAIPADVFSLGALVGWLRERAQPKNDAAWRALEAALCAPEPAARPSSAALAGLVKRLATG